MYKRSTILAAVIAACAAGAAAAAEPSMMSTMMSSAGEMVATAGNTFSSTVQTGLTGAFGSDADKALSREEQIRRQAERNEMLWRQTMRHTGGN